MYVDLCGIKIKLNPFPYSHQTLERLLHFLFLYNDSNLLHLRHETVIVRKRMSDGFDDYESQMVPGDKCDS